MEFFCAGKRPLIMASGAWAKTRRVPRKTKIANNGFGLGEAMLHRGLEVREVDHAFRQTVADEHYAFALGGLFEFGGRSGLDTETSLGPIVRFVRLFVEAEHVGLVGTDQTGIHALFRDVDVQ